MALLLSQPIILTLALGWTFEPTPLATRRAVLATAASALPLVVQPHAVHALAVAPVAGLSGSQMLTVGEYIQDIREARRGLEPIRSLLELQEERSFEAARIELRKPPVNNIRKPVSKTLGLLEAGPFKSAREAEYELVKKQLTVVDDLCRPGTDADKRRSAPAELTALEDALDRFSSAFMPPPPPPPPPAAPESAQAPLNDSGSMAIE